MPDSFGQFEKKWSSSEERQILGAKIMEDTQNSREVLKEHLSQKPETVMDPGALLTPEEKEIVKKTLEDPFFQEKREKIAALLQMVEEKGILPVASVVLGLDPSLEDAFHDVVIPYLRSIKNA